MYCSTCGVALAQGLSYCNYCGVKLGGPKTDNVVESSEVKPSLLVASMVVVFVLGLPAIVVLMGVMKTVLEIPGDRVVGFALFPFLILLILEGMFMRLLFRRKSNTSARATEILQGPETRELDGAQARGLPAPMASVTEHTTRTFAPIHDERTPK